MRRLEVSRIEKRKRRVGWWRVGLEEGELESVHMMIEIRMKKMEMTLISSEEIKTMKSISTCKATSSLSSWPTCRHHCVKHRRVKVQSLLGHQWKSG